MTDQSLLQRYAGQRDAEAFAELVKGYQRMVFAACRRTLHCSDDVDDAVQETFLRLAQKAGEIRSNLGAWLHRCAVNVATDLNRQREARRRREKVVALPAGAASDAQRELAELREQVDAALAKLEEEPRELIIQRYLVGRAMGEMAAELNVAGSTLTYRLNKAVEALRAELGSMGCAASVGVITAMMEVEQTVQVPSGLTANVMKIGLKGVGAKAAVGAGILGTIWGKAAVLAAGIVVAGGIWVVGAKGPASKPAATAPAGPVTFAEQAGDQKGGAPKWEAVAASARPAVLSGRVVDDAGKPVAGAKVSISTLEQRGDAPSRTLNTAHAVTDRDGRYVFATIAMDGEYTVKVEAEGYVRPDSAGSRWPQTKLQLSKAAEARRDLVIERGRVFAVSVLDREGMPMEGVRVLAWLQDGDEHYTDYTDYLQTDDTGLAMVTLPLGKSCIVAAVAEGVAPAHKVIKPEAGADVIDVELVMTAGHEVRGVITCSDGKPAVGCTVSLRPKWWPELMYYQAEVKATSGGEFVARAAEGENEVTVSNGHGGYRIGPITVPPAAAPVKLIAPFPSAVSLATLAGRVRLIGERPAQTIMVQAVSSTRDDIYGGVEFGPARDSKEGRYEIKDIPPGEYSLRFESSEIEAKTLEKVKIPGPVPLVELKVNGKMHLTGRVVDGTTGKPLTQFAVRVMKLGTLGNGPNYGQDTKWSQVANGDGRFSVELVGPGTYQAQISAAGHAWPWTQIVSAELGKSVPEVTVKMTSGGALAGRVVDEELKPVKGARVIAYSMARSCGVDNWMKRFDGDAGAVVTNGQGRFVQPHLSAGEELLKVVHPNYAPRVIDRLKVTDGTSTDVGDIAINVGGTVEGIVCDGSGNPEEGVVLRFQDETGYNGDEEVGRLASARTDAEGRYRLTRLPEQKVYVWAENRWMREGVVRQLIHPISGKTTKLDFGGAKNLSGRLVEDGTAVANRAIVLTSESPHVGPVLAQGKTDSQGLFAFRGVPAGQYSLYRRLDEKPSTTFSFIREVTIGEDGAALDDVTIDQRVDAGVVEVHAAADDPAVLARVRSVRIRCGKAKSVEAVKVGDVWRAERVPAGPATAQLWIPGESGGGVSQQVPFELKPADGVYRLDVSIPKSTSTLVVAAQAAHASLEWMYLARSDQRIEANVKLNADTVSALNLPPGRYHMIDPATEKPLDGVPPIDLSAGERTVVQTPVDAMMRIAVSVNIWTSDGRIVTDAGCKLFATDGTEVEGDQRWPREKLWSVKPGRYRVVAESADGRRASKDVEVADMAKGERRPLELDLFMP